MAGQAAGADLSAFGDHLAAPRGRGRLRAAAHVGAAGGAACGDLVTLRLRIDRDRVADAGFDASGCAAASAAASAAVELAAGRSFLEAARIGAGDVAQALGGLVARKRHAAELAADALQRALGAAAGAGAVQLGHSTGRTLVAISGGVDSAVAAQLALEAGDEVVAVTLELWADPANDGARSCCSPQAVIGARALAHGLGLPHVTLDMRSRFREQVVADYLAEHAAARTPNPCVRCNGLVRIDAMLALARSLGAARLATGHYARIAVDDRGPLLRMAADPQKDQTYMLARLAPDELARLWFPLGELTKPRVRELARRAGLSVADKAESQDLCFLAGTGRSAFLRRHGNRGSGSGRRGQIVDRAGNVLGSHEDQRELTVGQRRGVGIASTEPLYVLHKDARTNRVTVGPRTALATCRVTLDQAWLERPGSTVDHVKLRYRSPAVRCRLEGIPAAGAHQGLTVALASPVDGVAPGQTACLLRDDKIIGWAVIADQPASRPALRGAREAARSPRVAGVPDGG